MILWYCDILWYLVPRLDWWTPWKILWLYQRTIYYCIPWSLGKGKVKVVDALESFRYCDYIKERYIILWSLGKVTFTCGQVGYLHSLGETQPNEQENKRSNYFCWHTIWLYLLLGWRKETKKLSRPHVSRSNCLLSWTHDPEIKNSSCKTQKSGERHRTIIFKGKHLLETKLGDRMMLLWPVDWNWGMNIFHGLPSGRLSR